MKNCILLLCFIGVLQKCSASLSVSEYASEGTQGSLRCDFYIQKSTIHVIWYREENINITTCNYPGHCEFPRNQRYEAFIDSQYSTFVISSASFYKDDGMWHCGVNGLDSSTNFTVSSIPSSFRFTSPLESGIFVPDDGLTLNATAMCLYPKPKIVNLRYRIQGNKHYSNFTRRDVDIQYFRDGTSHCLKHQSVMIVTIALYSTDFHFERDTSVLFQFSYRLQSGKEKNTEEVIDLKFSHSRKVTSTICVNCETEITTQPASPGKLQNKSSEEWIIPVAVIITLLLIASIAIPIVYKVKKSRKGLSPGKCISNSYEQFDGSGSEISTPRSGMRSQETLQVTTRENRNNTKEENTEMEAQTRIVRGSSTTKQGEANHGKGRHNKGKGDESENSIYNSKIQNVSVGKNLDVDKNGSKISNPNYGLLKDVYSKQTPDPLERNYPVSSSVSSDYEDRTSRKTRGGKWRIKLQRTEFMDMFLLDPSDWSN